MKKILALFPTFVLIAIFLIGVYMHSVGQRGYVNYLVIGVAGTFVYTPVLIFVSGIASGLTSMSSGNILKWKQETIGFKAYYTYLVVIWILDIIIAMYFMTHN